MCGKINCPPGFWNSSVLCELYGGIIDQCGLSCKCIVTGAGRGGSGFSYFIITGHITVSRRRGYISVNGKWCRCGITRCGVGIHSSCVTVAIDIARHITGGGEVVGNLTAIEFHAVFYSIGIIAVGSRCPLNSGTGGQTL